MRGRPVLYLDLDDTILTWASGEPRAAPGAREFLLWASRRYEVRWLTRWCPSGAMEDHLIDSLCSMLELERDALREIAGLDWEGGESKLNGIAWLDHLVLRRPFLWLEDETGVGEREKRFLEEHGLLGAYRHCNVTKDADALCRVWTELERAEAA
jgi:hypothetical protein